MTIRTKPDEMAFARWMMSPQNKTPREYTDINQKRKFFILEKWIKKGFYEMYGDSIDRGWLTSKGRNHFAELFTMEEQQYDHTDAQRDPVGCHYQR